MPPQKKKANATDQIEAFEIKLERTPVENLAEVTETLDRARISAQKLIGKLAEVQTRGKRNGGTSRTYHQRPKGMTGEED